MFNDIQASRFYVNLLESVPPTDGRKLSKAVHDLYDERITAEESSENYKITKQDIVLLARGLNIK